MAFLGADTDQLYDLAGRMRLSMLSLQETEASIMRSVLTVPWEGPDADAMRDEARTRVLGRLTDLGTRLADKADELAENAREQDEVSDPRDFWQKLNDALRLPAQVTRLVRNAQKLIQDPRKMIDMFKRYGPLKAEYATLQRLGGEFPNLVEQARKAHKAAWWDELTGKGWEKLGGAIPTKISSLMGINIPGKEWMGKAFSHLDELAKAADANPFLKIGSKSFGKILPGVDIFLGTRQMLDPESTGYDRVSGFLSTAGGVLTLAAPLAGPAAPIVAGVGIGLGVVSAGMDLGKMAYENIPVVKNTFDSIGKGFQNAGDAIGEGAGKVGKFLGSIFG